MVVRKECCRGMGSSRGGELGNTCHNASLIPTKCHLASKISGLAGLSGSLGTCRGERGLWLGSGHVLGKLWGRRGATRSGRR